MTSQPCESDRRRRPAARFTARHKALGSILLAVAFAGLMLWAPGEPRPLPIQQAYIGPGAGIALVGSFLAVLGALFSAMLALLFWPIRWIWRALRNRRALARAKTKRVVILGLDGLDPELVDEFLSLGLLPNLAGLKEEGSYIRLGTTWPPLSPVAWSSFSTGTNPGKHNIFDFISRNKADYLPAISSVRIGPPRREIRIGRYRIPLSAPPITGLRKSKPFWNVLGEAGIFSSILRVPITFPPDRFRGVQLSAMCVPDLRGTQGTFTFFSETGTAGATADGDVGGQRVIVERAGNTITGRIPGPINPLRVDAPETELRFRVIRADGEAAILHIDGQQVRLPPDRFTDWVRVSFRMGMGVKVHGVCRFLLKQFEPFEMYCTPANIDPDRPVMPISHPKVFSIYLAKLLGTYSTLGLAEDTWSLSEGINTEEEFLAQAYDIHAERERMFFDSLRRVPRGVVTCVFDGPDRIQHMFWRFLEDGHPALNGNGKQREAHRNTIREMYVRMDDLVGRTRRMVGQDTALFVMSDHGFKSFHRGVDLNAWLREHGYLALKNDAPSSDRTYLGEVDWNRTRAYAIGLAGIYINQQGREAQGIVPPGEPKRRLVQELCEQLTGLRDEARGEEAIHEAVASEAVYRGPYVAEAPDLIIGYNVGYRVSWESAVGKCGPKVISDNTKAWSGDHCIHPRLVPGILFSNLKLTDRPANIVDLAPTTLDLLGVDTPAYMEGSSLLKDD
jgi:predicted AlkP superfamily phosphohydrolase/phosphomutase